MGTEVNKPRPRAPKGHISDAKKRQIAAGRVAGKTHGKIAQELHLAESSVKRTATKDPVVKAYMQQFADKKAVQIERMYNLALDAVEADLKQKTDKYARGYAVDRVLRIVEAADRVRLRLQDETAAKTGADGRGQFSLEELLLQFRRVTTTTTETPGPAGQG